MDLVRSGGGSSVITRHFVRGGYTGIETRDEEGRTRILLSDGWGSLAFAEQPSVRAKSAAQTRYLYNAVGDVTVITDAAGNTIRTSYDTMGRPTRQDDPDRGTTINDYDAVGNLVKVTDARGRVMVYTYDAINRRISEQDLATTATGTWTYDEAGRGHGIGRLTSVHDPSATGCAKNTARELTYDVSGNTTKDTRCVRGTPEVFQSTYDPLGRLHTLTYPDGETIRHIYDVAGRLYSIPGYVQSMAYNARGQLVSAEYANDTKETWTHDPSRSWLQNQRVTGKNEQHLFDETISLDGSGTVTGVTETVSGKSEKYSHDVVGRLTDVTGTGRQHFDYDDLGNITTNSAVGPYTYPPHRECQPAPTDQQCAGPHAVTATASSLYEYDATGNMTSVAPRPQYTVRPRDTLSSIAFRQLGDSQRWREIFALNKGKPYPAPPGGLFTNPERIVAEQRLILPAAKAIKAKPSRRLTWSTQGQLSHIQDTDTGSITNLYNADGTRVQQSSPSEVTKFYGGLADWTSTGGLTKYVYAGPLLVARRNSTGTLWYTTDRLGSPRLTTNDLGTVTGRHAFTVFGARETTELPEPVGYTGHRDISGSGLIDMLGRAYDPRLARTISADAIIPDITNPQALNRYSYAYNNPLNYTDPTGHEPRTPEQIASDQAKNDDWNSWLEMAERHDDYGSYASVMSSGLTPPQWGDIIVTARMKENVATVPVPTPFVEVALSATKVLGDSTAAAPYYSYTGPEMVSADSPPTDNQIREADRALKKASLSAITHSVLASLVYLIFGDRAAVAAENLSEFAPLAAPAAERAFRPAVPPANETGPRGESARAGVQWVEESAAMSDAAARYQAGASGARTNANTRLAQAPQLNGVRFDGFDEMAGVLIDRKLSVTTFTKSMNQAVRQSQALSAGGYAGLWEVPTAAQAARAQRMFDQLGISNISVSVVPR